MSVKGVVSIGTIHPKSVMTTNGSERVLEYQIDVVLYIRPEHLAQLASMKDHQSRIVATLEEESP